MMYGFGSAAWWMMLMPLLWIVLIAAIVWAVVRLVQPGGSKPAQPSRETPLEILDRRYANGDIDDDAYTTARARLSGRELGAP